MAIIYGVDTTKPFGTKAVREAIVECFKQAHKEVLDKEMGEFATGMSQNDFNKLKEINIRNLVKKCFSDTGGDYDNPTKESLIGVCDELAKFAKHFRSEDIIKKHYKEIMNLVNKL